MTAGEGQSTVIRARQLTRSFSGAVAIDGVDLDVIRGEMFGLIGPDGAGKSTLIRVLCGILMPSGGEASVLGYDLARESERVKAHVGYLSQSFTLYGDLTVDENIEFFAELHGVAHFKARREELLELTRLAPFRRRLADALSGGMKKKLALACTMIHTPELIFLDEPSTGVDPVSRGELWNLLSGIVAGGVTVFLTTPYLDEADRCDRVGLIHGGRMRTVDTPAGVKRAVPGGVFRLTCVDALRGYRALRRRWSSSRVVRRGEFIDLWSPEGRPAADEARRILEQERLEPVQVEPVEPSMEDAFVAMADAGGGGEAAHV